MIDIGSGEAKAGGIGRIGSQPIALAAAAFVIIVIGVGSIALWRAYTGTSPEQDRVAVARQLQARAAQAAEQLAERTKALELSQQESIDQLQILQDQLEAVKRLLATQQNANKRLSDQVADLSGAIDSLRQSFASARPPEASSPSSPRKRSARSRLAIKGAHRKPAGARG
jgi:septal ring factor EnvC (AmiA/AmiB activator)